MKRITRRNFIKGALAVGASLALPYSRVRGADELLSRDYRKPFVVPKKV